MPFIINKCVLHVMIICRPAVCISNVAVHTVLEFVYTAINDHLINLIIVAMSSGSYIVLLNLINKGQ